MLLFCLLIFIGVGGHRIDPNTNPSSVNQPFVVERRSDKLTIVNVPDILHRTSREIVNIASNSLAYKSLNFPNYTPDNASVVLVFHTESGDYLLGGARSNPALKDKQTQEGNQYPEQINAAVGGYSPDPELSFREAALKAIKYKMFLNNDLPGQGGEAQKVLHTLCHDIDDDNGWEEKVCVHTDAWKEDGKDKTMCVLTAVKHLYCSDGEREAIYEALQTIMQIKKQEGASLRILSEFKFIEIKPIIENSVESYLDNEETKAAKAYAKYGDTIAVTFNDLAIATLSKSGAFQNR